MTSQWNISTYFVLVELLSISRCWEMLRPKFICIRCILPGFVTVLVTGLGSALDLAVKKGYLEKEGKAPVVKASKNRIEADNYSIEDKRYE